MTMSKLPIRLALALVPALMLAAAPATDAGGPHYTADGKLVLPPDWREWVFLSASLDMNYVDGPPMPDAHMFDNVFVEAAAWHEFQRTGHWPDKTVFVKEDRGGTSKGSINKYGQFQNDDLMGVEFHVHDEGRFKGGWGFFFSDGAAPAELVPSDQACYACHEAHGAVDTTFTQFYPTAKPIAVRIGTFRER
jgi:hypothetical protein